MLQILLAVFYPITHTLFDINQYRKAPGDAFDESKPVWGLSQERVKDYELRLGNFLSDWCEFDLQYSHVNCQFPGVVSNIPESHKVSQEKVEEGLKYVEDYNSLCAEYSEEFSQDVDQKLQTYSDNFGKKSLRQKMQVSIVFGVIWLVGLILVLAYSSQIAEALATGVFGFFFAGIQAYVKYVILGLLLVFWGLLVGAVSKLVLGRFESKHSKVEPPKKMTFLSQSLLKYGHISGESFETLRSRETVFVDKYIKERKYSSV